ncbi:MAG: hypothetical protein ABI718_11995 [Acidobacteriota bacterium]
MKVRLKTRNASDGMVLWSLTLGHDYEVLGLESDDYRVLDDTREPYLFPADCFVVVEAREPEFWVCSLGDEGERYCYPIEWSAPGFFEDYFDGESDPHQIF